MNKSLPNIQQCSACGKTGHKTQNCRTERNVNVKKEDRDFTKKEMSDASKNNVERSQIIQKWPI